MSPDQIQQAVYGSIVGSGESIIEGTVVALLPILWFLILSVHLARPYILNVVTKFSLRLGADLWWLVYAGLRDLLIVVTFVLTNQPVPSGRSNDISTRVKLSPPLFRT